MVRSRKTDMNPPALHIELHSYLETSTSNCYVEWVNANHFTINEYLLFSKELI